MKLIKLNSSHAKKVIAGAALAVASSSAFAAAPTTVVELAQGVSFSDLQSGMLTLFGSIATVAVVMLGGSVLLSKLGWRR